MYFADGVFFEAFYKQNEKKKSIVKSSIVLNSQ